MAINPRRVKHLSDIQLKQIKPAAFMEKALVPVEGYRYGAGLGIRSVPKGGGFVATAKAFGAKAAPVTILESADGSVRSVFDIQKDGFQLGMLFNHFKPPGVDLFIFDDVKVILKSNGGKSRIIFSGVLRMNSTIMKPFQKFTASGDGLLLGGQVELENDESISGKIAARKMTLTSAASFHVPIAEGVVFSGLQLNVDIGQGAGRSGWQITPFLSGKLQLSRLAEDGQDLACSITYGNGTLHVSGELEQLDLRLGNSGRLTMNDLQANFDIGKSRSIDLSATFTPSKTTFQLAGALTPTYAGWIASASSFTVDDLGLIFEHLTTMRLGMPDFGVTFKDVKLGLSTADGKVGGQELKEGVSIFGSVQVHGHTFTATADVQPDGISFVGASDDLQIGPVTIKKPRLEMQVFSAASGKASRFTVVGSATIEGVLVDCKLFYQRTGGRGPWTPVVYAGLDSSSFRLSRVIPSTKGTFVDSLRFSEAALIYALKTTEVKDPDFGFKAEKGLQLIGDLEGITAIDSLITSKQGGLRLNALFGSQVAISISMPESSRLQLGSSVSCDPFSLKVVLIPSPELQLLFGMNVTVPKQDYPLHFDLMLAMGAIEASGFGTMKGYWADPFGARGLKIGPELALEVGINYAQFATTGTPSKFAFAGGLQLGEVVARMAASISANPIDMILCGELAELTPANLISFANKAAHLSIPADAVPNFFGLDKLTIYCAPASGSIGSIRFDPGFSFACDLVLFGKRASAYFNLRDQGLIAKGSLDRLEIGPLTIGGRQGEDMLLDLELTMAKQALRIDGEFDFLGSSIGLVVDISNQGIEFEFEQSFLGMVDYTIFGKSSGSLDRPASLDFSLTAEFDNRLTGYLKTMVTENIKQAISAVETDIGKAQKKVDEAKAVYMQQFDHAQGELDKAQKDAARYLQQLQNKVAREKHKYMTGVESARRELTKAKAKYDRAFSEAQTVLEKARSGYDAAMRKAQADVDRAEQEYIRSLNAAKAKVDDAERQYNNNIKIANSELQAARNKLSSLKRERDSAARELKHLPWHKVYKGPYLVAKIASLEVAIVTANSILTACQEVVKSAGILGYAALQTAKVALDGVKTGVKYTAFESAKAVLLTTRIEVEGALNAAKQTLSGVQQGTEYAAWQAAVQALNLAGGAGRAAFTAAECALFDGQLAMRGAIEAAEGALEAIKAGSAAAAFESAKVVLEGAKQGSSAMLKLAEFAAKHSGDLVDVKRVMLTAQLKAIQRGELFKAEVDAVLFDQSHHWSLKLNVKQVGDFVGEMFKVALRDARKMIP